MADESLAGKIVDILQETKVDLKQFLIEQLLISVVGYDGAKEASERFKWIPGDDGQA